MVVIERQRTQGRGQGGAVTARRVARTVLRGRWALLTMVVIALAALMIGLGFWQFGRLQGRRAVNPIIAARLAEPPVLLNEVDRRAIGPGALEFRRVAVRGTFDYANEVVRRYTTFDGQAGVQVVTPLRIAGSDAAILVDRGWIPYQLEAPEARRPYQNEPGEVEVLGLVAQPRGAESEQAPTAAGGPSPGERIDAWPRIDPAAIGGQLPYPLLPFWITRLPVPGVAGPPNAAPPPELGDGTHLWYALQWWGFTLVLIVGYYALVARTTAPKRRNRGTAIPLARRGRPTGSG